MPDEKKNTEAPSAVTKEAISAGDAWSFVLRAINTYVKQEMKTEFGVDVGFKQIDSAMVLSYVSQVVLQRVKQRTRSKDERDTFKKMKEELIKRGIKF